METAFVEFTAKVGSWEPGHIESMPRAVADGYVAAGQATLSDQTAHLRRSLEADSERRFAALEERLMGALKPAPATKEKKPPGSGSGVEFDRLDNGDPIEPARLKQEERWYHAGQIMRAVGMALHPESPAEDREWGRNLLHGLYCQKRGVTYKVVPGDGREGLQRFNDDISVTRTGTESVSGGSTYGFLVKPEWGDSLFRIPIEESVVEPYAFQIPVGQALEFKMPALDQYGTPTAGQSAAYAGFQLARKGEITQRSYSDGKVDEIDYKITDLTAFTTYSRDLDADAFIRIGAMIQQVLGQAFMWKKDYEFLLGNGVGMPLGAIPVGSTYATGMPPSVLTVDRNTANVIVYEDLVAMMAQIHPAYWGQMYWITNAAQTLAQLMAIKNAAGNYVYQPNSLVGQWMNPTIQGDQMSPYNNLTWRAEGKLLGKPVLFSEKIPQLGSTGDLILMNPRYAYGVATRAGLEMGMSEHFLFDTDRIAVRWKLRNDARPLLRGPYVQSDGGITSGNSKVSWCSVLAAHH